jgi:hypothetical protein
MIFTPKTSNFSYAKHSLPIRPFDKDYAFWEGNKALFAGAQAIFVDNWRTLP